MQRRTAFPGAVAVTAAITLLGSTAYAQDAATVELGTMLGASIYSQGGETVTRIAVPGNGVGILSTVGAGSTLYTTFFSGGVMVQPALGFSVLSGSGETITIIGLEGHLGYAFAGAGANSFYVSAHPAFAYASFSGSSDSEFGAGFRIGYRLLAATSLAIRFEAGYRRWFDTDINEITIGMALGTLLGS